MTPSPHSSGPMRLLLPFMLVGMLLAGPVLGDAPKLEPHVAAMHPDGKWKVLLKDLYRYLARFYSGSSDARPVLSDYLERRMIETMARERGILVTERMLDSWIKNLDKQVRQKSGGTMTLDSVLKDKGMSPQEFRRRSRMAIMRERLARAVMIESDRSRDPDREVPESDVVFVIDRLFQKASKELDRSKLPDDVVARILDIDITTYQYGRELCFTLPDTEVIRALRGLILAKEVELLTGSADAPRPEDLAMQKRWFLDYERNRLQRQMPPGEKVKDQMIDAVLVKRGLTRELAFSNPAFLAQAKARGHFRRTFSEEQLRAYFDINRKRYGDRLEVVRLLIIARNQPVQLAGRKVRNLQQGKALADALWLRANQGQDLQELAAQYTEDNEVTKANRGLVPFAITENTPGYELTWHHANQLEVGEMSKPFFDAGRGYVIVKLKKRLRSPGFEGMREKVRRDAAEQAYSTWRIKALRAAIKSPTLLEKS